MGDAAFDTDPHGFDRLFRSGLDTAEIANRTGCAEAHVANTLHRMREARAVQAAAHGAPSDPTSLYALALRKGYAPSEARFLSGDAA